MRDAAFAVFGVLGWRTWGAIGGVVVVPIVVDHTVGMGVVRVGMPGAVLMVTNRVVKDEVSHRQKVEAHQPQRQGNEGANAGP